MSPNDLDLWLILLLAIATALGYLVGWISRKAHEAELIAPLKRLLDDIDAADHRRIPPQSTTSDSHEHPLRP